jgi:hypothetical protein
LVDTVTDRSSGMELKIVNPDPRYSRAALIEPATSGYIHVAAEVSPLLIPPQRLPFLPDRYEKTELLGKLKALGHRLEQLDSVEKVTVFEAVAIPPTPRFGSYLREQATSIRPARFDVSVLIETESPEAAREVQESSAYLDLVGALEAEARSTYVVVARNAKRIGDVDESRDGLFLFNHFVADDAGVMLELWDYLAGWYEEETDLDNSVLLVPLEEQESNYAAINHARWDVGLPRFLFRQLSKKSFRNYLLANMEANRVGAMPVLYRLADPHRRADRPINPRVLLTSLAVALALGLALREVLKRLGR